MQREKVCPYCKTIFFYDDGLDDVGLAGSEDTLAQKEPRTGYCPRCVDPNACPGETYEKESILTALKRYLRKEGVLVNTLDNDTLEGMLKEFPRAQSLYLSNGSYRTFTLYTGMTFPGMFGMFELGVHEYVQSPNVRWINTFRHIKCLRCNRVVKVLKTETLDMFLGMHEKRCFDCDNAAAEHVKANSNLKRGGAQRSEFSARALAKALNVSRNDYTRHPEIQYTPPLPVGHIAVVQSKYKYEILKAWWDESPKSYSPKYLIKCVDCKQEFTCVQKHLKETTHYCTGARNASK